MRRFTILMAFLLIACSLALHAQGTQIKGKVTSSEDGSTLPGATVMVKGTTNVTVTDADGNYTLNVSPEAAALAVSFVGMKTKEVPIAGQTQINVVLEPELKNIEEVVVTALGISRDKKALGYSVQEVKSDDITKTVNANVINALGGKIAGVQVTNSSGIAGGSSYVTIRGVNSITQNNQPLFVVDGVPIDNSSNYSGNPDDGTNNLTNGVDYSNRAIDLNADDIESVSVLKGGAATALYGLRAGNGVIVITTKKGSNTGGLKNANVTFSSSMSVDEVNQLPGLQMTYGQGEGGEWLGPDNANGNRRLSWGPRLDTMRYDGSSNYKFDVNGKLVSQNSSSATAKKIITYNNPDLFFKKGYTYNNSISISGGNDVSNIYASYSNLKTDGIIPNNKYAKNSFMLSAQTKVSKRLTVTGDANYINSNSTKDQQGSNVSGVMLGLMRTPPTFNDAAGYQFPDGTQRNFRGGIGYDNPFWTVNKNIYNDNINRLIGNLGLIYKISEWANINYKLGTDVYSDNRKMNFDINSRAYPSGQVSTDNHFNRDLNSDLMLNLDQKIMNDFEAKLILGQNMYQHYDEQWYIQGDQLTIPGYFQLNNAASILAKNIVGEKRTAALFGDLGLSFKNMLFYDGTYRREWSTTLPKGANNFGYYSNSLGFVFTELPGLKSNPVLTFGKIRASLSRVANDAPVYSTFTTYDAGFYQNGYISGISFPFNGTSGFQVGDGLGNNNLKPELLNSTEIGTELKFFENRVGIDFTYYKNHNTDLILSAPVSGATGYVSEVRNAAEMENKGVELVLNLVPVKIKSFEWDLTLNFTKNVNKVLQLAPGVDNITLGGFTGTDIRAVKGYSYATIFGQDFLRDKKGNIIIDDVPAYISGPDTTINTNYGYPVFDPNNKPIPLGSTLPDWTLGITNSFTVYDLSFSFLLDIKHGGKMWNGTVGVMNYFGTGIDTKDRDLNHVFSGTPGHIVLDNAGNSTYDADGNDIVATSGTKNMLPVKRDENWYTGNGTSFGGGPTSQEVEDASWVRLKEISVSYKLPNTLVEKTKFIKSFSVYFSGKNLWLSTKYSGVDPETSLYGASSSQGIDYFNMPGTKTYTFGIKAMF